MNLAQTRRHRGEPCSAICPTLKRSQAGASPSGEVHTAGPSKDSIIICPAYPAHASAATQNVPPWYHPKPAEQGHADGVAAMLNMRQAA